MSFSDYKTLSQVQTEYQIKYDERDFIPKSKVSINDTFLKDIDFNMKTMDAFSSEAARCELIILPLLREAYKNFSSDCSLWVQKPIRYNNTLNGTPDYMLSKRSELGKTVLELPLLMIVEAKKNDFEQGWAQCLAELITAQKLNNNHQAIYGIVTDGKYWEFGQLIEASFCKNNDSFGIDDLPFLLGALNHIFTLAKKNIIPHANTL
ncbi:MAG: hypothetical protein KAH08_04780 [Methylococcales bacterium]|nr:hypothetical protein [Methylococcales bacterium]